MLHVWIALWLVGSFGMILPAALMGWALLPPSPVWLFAILLSICTWGGAMARVENALSTPGESHRIRQTFTYRIFLPILAAAGVWLSVLAFLFPHVANLLFFFALILGGCPSLFFLLITLRRIERSGHARA